MQQEELFPAVWRLMISHSLHGFEGSGMSHLFLLHPKQGISNHAQLTRLQPVPFTAQLPSFSPPDITFWLGSSYFKSTVHSKGI